MTTQKIYVEDVKMEFKEARMEYERNDNWDEYYNIDEPEHVECLEKLSVSELMGEDFSVWLVKNKRTGYDLHLENFDTGQTFKETGIHNCAIDSMAEFCRAFLNCYARANR